MDATEGRSDAATVVGDAAADDGGVADSSRDDNRSDAGGTSTSVDVVDAAVPPLVCEDAGADAACVPDDCGSGSCESDGSTPVPECRRGDNPCATSQIVRFSGEHVLDGVGDEFCDVPGFELSFSNAAAGAADLPQSALVRVAWSPEALHLFAEVSDPDVAVNGNLDWLWDGDAVELYLATSEAAQLPGFFSGRIDGVQMVFAPPSGEQRARAARLFWLPNDDGSFRQVREEITRDFSARVTAEGYSIEAKVQWSKFGPRTPDMHAGMAIAFDLALSTASSQSLAAGGREGAAVLYVGDSASGVNTCDGDQLPWCNSTTWCSPVLQ